MDIGNIIGNLIKAWSKTNRWHRMIATILLLQFGGVPQRKPGFYCNDALLSHPYTGDTISWKLLLAVTLLFPLPFMFVLEALISRHQNNSKEGYRLPQKTVVLRWYVEYTYGLLLDLALIQIIKVLVGEPRPHFFDVCKPDTKCEGSEFVSSYQCTKTIYSDIRMADAGRSFPSGHSSIAMHAGLFMAWYLRKRTVAIHSNTKCIILLIQVLLVVSAVFCGLSRITDRRHHWWDVLAGAILGVGILVYTIRSLCNNFEYFCVSNETQAHNSDAIGKLVKHEEIHPIKNDRSNDGMNDLSIS